MSGHLIPVSIGETKLWVETTPVLVAGSQPTASPGDQTGQVVNAFGRARDAIVEVAKEVAATADQLAERGLRPDRVEVEFGLRFTAQGSVFLVAASGESSLRVVMSYDAVRKG
jgi:hypothetical protein